MQVLVAVGEADDGHGGVNEKERITGITMSKQTPKSDGTIRLLEIAVGGDFRIDEEQAVLRDVRILGPDSRNGRTYLPAAMSKGRGLYENIRVNVDHPAPGDQGKDRSVASRFGWLANVREAGGGLIGDLHYLKSHPNAPQIIEAARRRPDLFGLSHNADGKSRREGGKQIVEEITRVRSVDIVSDPASTRSLFESLENETMDPETAPPTETIAAGDPIKEMLLAKIAEIYDGEGDPATKAKAIGAVAKEVLKVQDAIDAATEVAPAEGEAAAAAATESLRREVGQLKTRLAVRELLESEGVAANPAVIKALESLGNDTDRKALLAVMPKAAGETTKARSTGRLAESVGAGGNTFAEPKNTKDFAKQLTGGRR